MFLLSPNNPDLRFPPVELASPEGLLAVGGDLRSERLLQAYRQGIFPWYSEGQPILWWSPDPRAVLFPGRLKVSHSLRKTLRQQRFILRADTAFSQVVQACAAPRPQYPEGGTWITRNMAEAYQQLHHEGYAHSLEVWYGEKLVGGLYGLALGRAFFGESMFSDQRDASKIALAALSGFCMQLGIQLIDCQVPSAHLLSLGAQNLRRHDFIQHLDQALRHADDLGPWILPQDILAPWVAG